MGFAPTAAGGACKIEIQINASFVEINGVTSAPPIGQDPQWIESRPINSTTRYYTTDTPAPVEFEIAGDRQKTDPGQVALMACGLAASTAGKTVNMKFTYGTDVLACSVIVGSFKASGNAGENIKFAAPSRITGTLSWT